MVSLDNVDLDDKLSDLTLDAVAEPPRKTVDSKDIQNEIKSCRESAPKVFLDNKKHKSSKRSQPNVSKKKASEANSSKIYGNVINVSNSSHVQVGPTTVYNFGINKPQENKTNINIQRTKEVQRLFDNTDKLTNNELDCISSHVGENWKDLGRKLDYSDGQLEQFYVNFHGMKIKEVIYQMLLDWTRVNPKKSTVGQICSVLWECDMKEVVLKLSTAITLENNEK